VETVIATEGQALGGGQQLAGWGEFYDMNNSGLVAFKAQIAGLALSSEPTGSGADESGIGLFTGNGGALTKIVQSGDVVATRTICGIAPMISLNDAGQVAFEAYHPQGTNCGQTNKGIFRFTTGPGVEFLLGVGSTVSAGVTITMFDADDPEDTEDLDINTAGSVVIPARLSNGNDAIYLLTGPGTFVEIARSGTAGPGGNFDRVAARPELNNVGQVALKAAIGGDGNPTTDEDGLDSLLLFTPPSTYQVIAQEGQAAPSGGTYQGFGAYVDVNDAGDVVFKADLLGIPAAGDESDNAAGLFRWTRLTNTFTEFARTGATYFGFFNPVLTINNQGAVAFGARTAAALPGIDTDIVEGSLWLWPGAGAPQQLIAIGDTLDGNVVSTVFAQHLTFDRQFNATCSVATQVFTNSQNEDQTEVVQNPKLFGLLTNVCPGGLGPTATPTQTGQPTSTPTVTTTPVVGQVPVIPTLSVPMLILLGLALAGVAFLVLRKV
jgi:hypothetical protein